MRQSCSTQQVFSLSVLRERTQVALSAHKEESTLDTGLGVTLRAAYRTHHLPQLHK